MGYHLGLLGYPLEHSLSPRLHQAALQACGLAGDYILYPIPVGEGTSAQLKKGLNRVRTGELQGLNVTIPYKRAVMDDLDELSAACRAIGAVNTISYREGRLVGDNTDAPGFLADLSRVYRAAGERPGQALVLGAGGAARAVAYALYSEGWQVVVAARRKEQGEALATSINRAVVEGGRQHFVVRSIPLDRASVLKETSSISLVVNATSAGMAAQADLSPWPQDTRLPPGAFLYDLVYNPPQTRWILDARRSGLAAANGIGMLVEQAALAFKLWTGHTPSRPAMFQAVSEFGG